MNMLDRIDIIRAHYRFCVEYTDGRGLLQHRLDTQLARILKKLQVPTQKLIRSRGGLRRSAQKIFDTLVAQDQDKYEERYGRTQRYKTERNMTDVLSINVLRPCRVAMLTFGGKQFYTWDPAKLGPISCNFVVEKNCVFTVLQSGLNYYIFPTSVLDWRGHDFPMSEQCSFNGCTKPAVQMAAGRAPVAKPYCEPHAKSVSDEFTCFVVCRRKPCRRRVDS
jgi:hypothetical protein